VTNVKKVLDEVIPKMAAYFTKWCVVVGDEH
jgi:hypothetical protein